MAEGGLEFKCWITNLLLVLLKHTFYPELFFLETIFNSFSEPFNCVILKLETTPFLVVGKSCVWLIIGRLNLRDSTSLKVCLDIVNKFSCKDTFFACEKVGA